MMAGEVTTMTVDVSPGQVHEIDVLLRELLKRHAGEWRAGDLIVYVITCTVAQVLARGRAEGLSLDDALEDVDAFMQAGRDAGIQIALHSPFAEGWK